MTWIAVGGAALKLGGSLFGASKAKKRRRAAAAKAARIEAEVLVLEESRGEVVNPYDETTDLSGLAQDVSSLASVSTMNLSVSTGAAEMQAEEADIALANTLDTLAATGASAGGATALAQAALKSKEGVANSIESQEATNNTLREQSRIKGEERVQDAQMSEAQRIQNTQISEGRRTQKDKAAGKAYVYEEEQDRISEKIARKTGKQREAKAEASAAGKRESAFTAGAFSAGADLLGQGIGALSPKD